MWWLAFFNSGFSSHSVAVGFNDFPCGLNGKDVVTARGWLKIKESVWVLLSKKRRNNAISRAVLLFQGSLVGLGSEKW